MNYKEASFNACVFNPLVKGKLLSQYPRISEIIDPVWAVDPHLDNLLRYIILMYDVNSPLIKDEKDLNYRKGIAANIAGFDMEDQGFLDAVYSFTHPFLVELTIKFLIRFIKSKEFTAIVVVENCFWESVSKLMEPIKGTSSNEILQAVQKKAAIKTEIDNDMARLEKYYRSFYGEDEVLEEKGKRRITAESVAGIKK